MNTYLDPELHIVLVSDSGRIPSFYVRFLDPVGLMTKNYNVVPTYEEGAEAIAQRADVLIVQRWLEPSTLAMVEAAKGRGVPVIYETDDNLLDLPKESGMAMSDAHIRNLTRVLDLADLVVCSTDALAHKMAAYNPNVAVIKNYGLPKDRVPTVGRPHLAVVNTDYFKLSSSKAGFFTALRMAVEDLNYKISFFGSVDPDMVELRSEFPDDVNIINGFIDDRSAFLDRLAHHGINVAAVPLDDTDQHLIKSDIKFLDFASLGVPAIFNNVRVYEEVRHEVDGFMADDTQSGWFEALEFFSTEQNRQRCGDTAYDVVSQRRGLSSYAEKYALAISSLVERGGRRTGDRIIDRTRSGLFWQGHDLVLLHDGSKRHVINKSVIGALVSAGFGFIDPTADELSLVAAQESLREVRQVSGLPPLPGQIVARKRTLPASGRPLTISWIIPGLIIGGGGHRNIIRCAYHLERLGHRVSLHFVDIPDSADVVRSNVREHFYPFDGDVRLLDDDFQENDIVFATHWSTIAHAERFADRIGEIVYFVQDFEPYFYAMGSDYVLAENTYKKGYYSITSGIWCEHFIRNTYHSQADHFQFPIDKNIYFDRRSPRRKDRIIFFAKPEMPRRCYEIGVQALRELNRLRPEIEIVFFGSSHQRPVDFPVVQLGMLPGPDDLAKLYNEATIGLAFSTTNPSLVPYEMMACGLPVVDLAREGNETNYDNGYDLARLVNPDPVVMAREISNFISDPADMKARSERSLAFAATFPEEEDVGRRIEALLLKRVANWDSEALRRATGVSNALSQSN